MRAGPVNCQILLGGERDRTGPLAGASRAYKCANAYATGTGTAKRARSAGSTEHGQADPEPGSLFDYMYGARVSLVLFILTRVQQAWI